MEGRALAFQTLIHSFSCREILQLLHFAESTPLPFKSLKKYHFSICPFSLTTVETGLTRQWRLHLSACLSLSIHFWTHCLISKKAARGTFTSLLLMLPTWLIHQQQRRAANTVLLKPAVPANMPLGFWQRTDPAQHCYPTGAHNAFVKWGWQPGHAKRCTDPCSPATEPFPSKPRWALKAALNAAASPPLHSFGTRQTKTWAASRKLPLPYTDSVALSPLLSPVPSSHVPSKHYTAPGPEETQPEGTQRLQLLPYRTSCIRGVLFAWNASEALPVQLLTSSPLSTKGKARPCHKTTPYSPPPLVHLWGSGPGDPLVLWGLSVKPSPLLFAFLLGFLAQLGSTCRLWFLHCLQSLRLKTHRLLQESRQKQSGNFLTIAWQLAVGAQLSKSQKLFGCQYWKLPSWH